MADPALKPKVRTFFPQKTDKKAYLPLHVKILTAEVKLEAETKGNRTTLPVALSARFVLNDFREEGVVFFCARAIQTGTPIGFELEDPSPLKLKGRVHWCRETRGSGRVIAEQHFPYRIALLFEFPEAEAEKAEAKKALEEFLAKARAAYLSFQVYE